MIELGEFIKDKDSLCMVTIQGKTFLCNLEKKKISHALELDISKDRSISRANICTWLRSNNVGDLEEYEFNTQQDFFCRKLSEEEKSRVAVEWSIFLRAVHYHTEYMENNVYLELRKEV